MHRDAAIRNRTFSQSKRKDVLGSALGGIPRISAGMIGACAHWCGGRGASTPMRQIADRGRDAGPVRDAPQGGRLRLRILGRGRAAGRPAVTVAAKCAVTASRAYPGALATRPHPPTRAEGWTRLLRSAGRWRILGYGYLVVEDRATGRFLGVVGLPEAGWVMARPAQGRGLGREAVQAALAWLDEILPTARTTCMIGSDLAASLRLARRVGFREIGSARFAGEVVTMLDRPR
jgi:RimJ/RimL family protein N-acetyltransferase